MHNRFCKGAIRALTFASILILVVTGNPWPHAAGTASAAQVVSEDSFSALLAHAIKAVNARRVEDLVPLLSEGAFPAFAWVPKAHETWEGAVLPLPDSAPTHEALVVFHAWHSCQSDGDHVHRLVPSGKGWRLGPEIPETETLGFRVRDHDLHVTLNVPAKNATLTDTVQVERTAESIPAFGLLRLSHDFHVASMTEQDASGTHTALYRQAGGVIAFTPPNDRKFTLTLHYSGHLDNRQSDYIHTNEAVLCSYWYPHIARLPARTTVTATTPPHWRALAQGELTHETQNPDGGTTVTFRNEVPNCFYTLDFGQYTITTRKVKERSLSVYQLRPNAALAQACLNRLSAAMDYYDHNFAPFPFTRYAIVETQGAFPGALEAYSFSTYGPNTLPELIQHELAHTWWGGMIPCTYTHSMWDEAFAEYSDDLFTHSQPSASPNTSPLPPSAAKLLSERLKNAEAYKAIPIAQAFDTEDDQQIAAGYEKGHKVLKMLEDRLGQPLMLRCMRRFFADHTQGEAADWPEFEAAVQKETGADYRWFFGEWLERPGMPRLALAHTTVQKDKDGYLVETDVVQEGNPYRLALLVQLELATGQPLRSMQEIEGTMTHLQFHVASAPTRLRLDPLGDVLFSPPLGSPAGSDPTLITFRP